jgi:diguanylate cyclase (GGDEF)-like protein
MDYGDVGGGVLFVRPARSERVAAGLTAALAVVIAIAVAPVAQDAAPASPGLVAIVYSGLMLAAVAMAWMLAALYRVSSRESLVVLATAYGVAAVTIALYVVAIPGVISRDDAFAGSITAATLWSIGHAGFIALSFAYAFSERIAGTPDATPRARRAVRVALGCVLLPLCVAVGITILRHVAWGAAPDPLAIPALARGVAPALALGYVAAAATIAFVTRLRTSTSLWATVVLAALACEVVAGGALASRFYSNGWYVGCLEGVVACGAFFNVIARTAGRALSELAASNRILADRSVRDALTELLNRRGFEERLATLGPERQRRTISAISLLAIDVDRFKSVNDRFGHTFGDRVLRDVAAAIAEATGRPRDACFRIGGEEFAVVLAATDRTGAGALAERIRCSVLALRPAPVAESDLELSISVSVGSATMEPSPALDGVELYRRADLALMEAKSGGRNRYVAYESMRLVS